MNVVDVCGHISERNFNNNNNNNKRMKTNLKRIIIIKSNNNKYIYNNKNTVAKHHHHQHVLNHAHKKAAFKGTHTQKNTHKTHLLYFYHNKQFFFPIISIHQTPPPTKFI